MGKIRVFWLPVASGIVFLAALLILINHVMPGRFTPFASNSPAVLELKSETMPYLNQPFKVTVEMDTFGSSVNAVGVYLRFDPSFLRVLNYDTQSSFCQFYPEKKFDNNAGTVTLACGSPHPGAKGQSQLINLEFLPLKIGTTVIYTLPESQLLKSDGSGTNILEDVPPLSLDIKSNI